MQRPDGTQYETPSAVQGNSPPWFGRQERQKSIHHQDVRAIRTGCCRCRTNGGNTDNGLNGLRYASIWSVLPPIDQLIREVLLTVSYYEQELRMVFIGIDPLVPCFSAALQAAKLTAR
jgi:hypothetical protein